MVSRGSTPNRLFLKTVHSYLARTLPLENEEITKEVGPSHPSFSQMMTELWHSEQPRVDISPAAVKAEFGNRYCCISVRVEDPC